MTELRVFLGTDSDWDQLLLQLGNASIYSSHKWSGVMASSGWSSLRLVTANQKCALQVFYKRISHLLAIAWIPGGFAGTTEQIWNSWGRDIQRHLASRSTYVRIAFPNHKIVNLHADSSWNEVESPMGAQKTVVIDLSKPHEQLREDLRPNWRRNLRRSEKFSLSVRTLGDSDTAAINHLEDTVMHYKQLPSRTSRHGGDTVELLGEHALTLGVFDEASRLLSVRGAAIFGDTARDIVAATSPEGRRVYASYLATWALLSMLKDRGLTSFDLSGIDDLQNKGVSDFKRGLGGAEFAYLAEYHQTTPHWLVQPVARLIQFRLPGISS